jgi:hypothetical protein
VHHTAAPHNASRFEIARTTGDCAALMRARRRPIKQLTMGRVHRAHAQNAFVCRMWLRLLRVVGSDEMMLCMCVYFTKCCTLAGGGA